MDPNVIGWLGLSCTFVGHLLLAGVVLAVHYRVKHDKGIDDQVFKLMQLEMQVGGVAVLLLISGYVLESFVILTL